MNLSVLDLCSARRFCEDIRRSFRGDPFMIKENFASDSFNCASVEEIPNFLHTTESTHGPVIDESLHDS